MAHITAESIRLQSACGLVATVLWRTHTTPPFSSVARHIGWWTSVWCRCFQTFSSHHLALWASHSAILLFSL